MMTDTPPHIEALQKHLVGQLSGEERFGMGLKMAEDGWQLMLAGIRARHPDATEAELRLAVLQHLQRFDEAYRFVRL
jgi:hypothetical protein